MIRIVLFIAASFLVNDVIADDDCAKVQALSNGLKSFCRLNDSLTCSDNTSRALKECIPASIGIILIIFLLILLPSITFFLYRRLKRKKRGYQKVNRDDDEAKVKCMNTSCSSPPVCSDTSQSRGGHGQLLGAILVLYNRIKRKRPTSIHEREKSISADESSPAHSSSATSGLPISIPKGNPQQMTPVDEFSGPYSLISHRSTASYRIRKEVRSEEMIKEEDKAKRLAQRMFHYCSLKELNNLGSRLQKYWYMVKTKQNEKRLQFIVLSSNKCQLKLEDPKTIQVLNTLFGHIKHPSLLSLHDIAYEDGYIGIVQWYAPKGSIRDYLFEAQPTDDWVDKYHPDGGSKEFPLEEIAKCGQQVLEAVEVLYDLGFPVIGHIHAGNVFIVGDHYALGGYENAILGYRTCCYADLESHMLLDKIDVIMFGHLIYEMSTMRLFLDDNILPTNFDFEKIENSDLLEVNQLIFETAKKKKPLRKLMQHISNHPFFTNSKDEQVDGTQMKSVELPPEAVQLLTAVFSTASSDVAYKELKLEEIIPKLDGKYVLMEPLSTLGQRFGKVWAKVRNTVLEVNGLLTAVVVPHTCPIYVAASMKAIRQLLTLQHEHVHSVRDVDHIILDGRHVIITFQDFIEQGSLKDMIYQCLPATMYENKYRKKGKKIKPEKIAQIGGQILQVMHYLSHLGDVHLALGFVHTGNIFVEGDVYRLGGFENAVLGYRTYNMFESCKHKLDVVMFGHVIFEMCTGRKLMKATPTDRDYKDVPKDMQPLMQYIFSDDCTAIDMIMSRPYFAPAMTGVPEVRTALDSGAIYLLHKVQKGKARNQDDAHGKTKFVTRATINKATSILHI